MDDCQKYHIRHFMQLSNYQEEHKESTTWWERTTCTDTHLDSNKLANVRRYILKSNRLTDAEKDNIKEHVITDI